MERIWRFLKKVVLDIDHQIWNRSGPHGAAELGAALANGSPAYVMYGHTGKHDNGPQNPAQPERSEAEPQPQQERERGGRTR